MATQLLGLGADLLISGLSSRLSYTDLANTAVSGLAGIATEILSGGNPAVGTATRMVVKAGLEKAEDLYRASQRGGEKLTENNSVHDTELEVQAPPIKHSPRPRL